MLATFGGDVAGPLFLSESHRNPGAPLGIGAFNDIVDHLRTAVGLPALHPHTFRHLRGHILERCGAELEDIRIFLGHRDVRTTYLYLDMGSQRVSARIRKAIAPFDTRMSQLIEEIGRGDHPPHSTPFHADPAAGDSRPG